AQVWRPLAPDVGPGAAPLTVFDPAFLAEAAAYRRPLYVAAAAAVAVRLGMLAAIALSPIGRRLVRRLVDAVGPDRPATAAAAVATGAVVAADLAVLPLALWAGYVHDGIFGLRTQGLGGWAYDWLVAHGPVWLAVAVGTAVGYRVARRIPRSWAPVGGLAVGVLGGLVVFVSPVVLEPLTYRFTPLPDGPVRTEVERVLATADARVEAVVVADASRRTTRQNAYISGLATSRRVVLYDTLVDQRRPDEVGVVVAHELAHDRHGDLPRMVALTVAGAVLTAYVLRWSLSRRIAAGRQATVTDPRGAAIVVLIIVVLTTVSAPVQSVISRRAEAAADVGSLQLGGDPDAFRRMHVALTRANLSEPRPPRLVTWWWGSHPPTMQRLALADWWDTR
ncbi:MAG TPA: M48 family metalloprotease, partial [Egibacteraceae bacterium]|nr:M48 family metalloprotease [Egibacteraceae bacterium]